MQVVALGHVMIKKNRPVCGPGSGHSKRLFLIAFFSIQEGS